MDFMNENRPRNHCYTFHDCQINLGKKQQYIDGLGKYCSSSIAKALELLQSCTKPSIYKVLTFADTKPVWDNTQQTDSRHRFTKRTDFLPKDLVKSRRHEIKCYNDHIGLKFDRHLGSAAAEVLVKFQSDWKSLNPNPVASRLHEVLR